MTNNYLVKFVKPVDLDFDSLSCFRASLSEYDITEGSAYIPDASSWRYANLANDDFKITRVVNGIAYND